MYDVALSEVYAHSGAAYFLSKEGTLYCTGADSDSAAYVVCQNPSKGIVAENVKSFGELIGGGYYINQKDDLYIWNETAIPLYGYNQTAEQAKILENVKFVAPGIDCFIYIDTNSNLYLIGKFGEEIYSIENPKQLAKNVTCADIKNTSILWAESNGTFNGYGNTDTGMTEKLNARFKDSIITNIYIGNFVSILSNQQLWYYGDYEKLVTGKGSQSVGLTMLSDNIAKVSCSASTIVALGTNRTALIWGRCISNDAQQTDLPQFEYYEEFSLAKNAENVYVSDSCVCFIDTTGKSNIFYFGGWPAFYGNSTKDACVGIKRNPIQWIK